MKNKKFIKQLLLIKNVKGKIYIEMEDRNNFMNLIVLVNNTLIQVVVKLLVSQKVLKYKSFFLNYNFLNFFYSIIYLYI